MELARDEEPQAARPQILVVDDYAPNVTALRALLEPIAAVTDADCGTRALEEASRREFAVVVLDVNMPRVDGLEVARRIRAGRVNGQVPIIFLTSMDSDSAQILDGYAAGGVDYLRRPFSPEILRSKVSIFVELHERREQAKRESAERAQLEAQRLAAEQASRDKDRFLAVLSHELRTPLTSILLWSDMLLRRELPVETVRRGLETIDLCARYEAHIVERVLEMSRLITGTHVAGSDRGRYERGGGGSGGGRGAPGCRAPGSSHHHRREGVLARGRRPAAPAAGGLQPAGKRGQLHAGRGARRPDPARTTAPLCRSRFAIPASGLPPTSCRTCSRASSRAARARRARAAVWAWDWRWPRSWSSCTAAASPPRAPARDRGPRSPSRCRTRNRAPAHDAARDQGPGRRRHRQQPGGAGGGAGSAGRRCRARDIRFGRGGHGRSARVCGRDPRRDDAGDGRLRDRSLHPSPGSRPLAADHPADRVRVRAAADPRRLCQRGGGLHLQALRSRHPAFEGRGLRRAVSQEPHRTGTRRGPGARGRAQAHGPSQGRIPGDAVARAAQSAGVAAVGHRDSGGPRASRRGGARAASRDDPATGRAPVRAGRRFAGDLALHPGEDPRAPGSARSAGDPRERARAEPRRRSIARGRSSRCRFRRSRCACRAIASGWRR